MAVAATEKTYRGMMAKNGAIHWKLMPKEYIVGAQAADTPVQVAMGPDEAKDAGNKTH
jgi:hypothetical protein